MLQRVPRSSIVLLVPSLEVGGAERQVVELALRLVQRGRRVVVMVFRSGGALEADLHESRVPLVSLKKGRRRSIVSFAVRLVRELYRERPAILYGYLPAPNLMCVLVKLLLFNTHIVWGVRASDVDMSYYNRFSQVISLLERLCARMADLVIVNSHAGKSYAVARGFPAQKMVVVSNGIDTSRFKLDALSRRKVREEWCIGKNEPLIGLVARLDPMKDHLTFLRAAAKVAEAVPNVRFVCVGVGPSDYTLKLQEEARLLLPPASLIWAGMRRDMPAVYSALDIACSSSSFGEGFSNAIGEAMACGVPCVVTNVGDSALILGDTGLVVERKSPDALAEGLVRLAILPASARAALGTAARLRIATEFCSEKLVQDTEEAFGLL